MAEACNSLSKAECLRNPAMRPEGDCARVSDVELAVAEYVEWFNHRRLMESWAMSHPPSTRTTTGQPPRPSAALTTPFRNQPTEPANETRGDSQGA